METLGLYEVEQLSLFGDQLLIGFGSPMEPDSPVNSPDSGPDSNHLDMLGLAELDDKPKAVENCVALETGHLPGQESPSGLEFGWMDTKHDIVNLLQDHSATDPGVVCHEATLTLPPQTIENDPSVNISTVSTLASQDALQLGSGGETKQPTPDMENELLSEVFKLLDSFSDDVTNIPDLTGDVLSPVSVDDIESLLADSEGSQTDSALESLLSSCPESPVYVADSSSDPPYEPSQPEQKQRTKSKRGRRSAPYSKLPADKKERKKIQNKTAALKYRQKKKQESKQVFTEVEILEDKNKKLHEKVDSISREIKYLKSLMGDILKAKGVVV